MGEPHPGEVGDHRAAENDQEEPLSLAPRPRSWVPAPRREGGPTVLQSRNSVRALFVTLLRHGHSIQALLASLLHPEEAILLLFATLLRPRHPIGRLFATLLRSRHSIGTLCAAHLHSRVPKAMCFCGAQTGKTTLSSIAPTKWHWAPWYFRNTEQAKEGIRTYI